MNERIVHISNMEIEGGENICTNRRYGAAVREISTS